MFFTILFSTTVIVIGIYLFFGLPWKHHELKDEMIQYLEKRYKDDFSLGTLHYQIVNKNVYHTMATAKSTNVSFHIEITPDGKTIEDAYSYEYWSEAGEKFLKPIFKQHLHDMSWFYSDIYLLQEEVFQLDTLNNNRDVAYWNVSVGLGYSLDSENKTEELQKIINLIHSLKDEGFIMKSLSFDYLGNIIIIPDVYQKTFTDVDDLIPYLKFH